MPFLISGEFVTRHARDRMWEYGCDDALRFLRESLPELLHDDALELLAGATRFVGDSRVGLELEPELEAVRDALVKQHRWRYAGVWFDRSHKVYFRPYARVTGWGPDDMARHRVPNRYQGEPRGSMLMTQAGGDPEGWARYRSVYYMDDRENDQVMLTRLPDSREQQLVLWKPCPCPPVWWTVFRTPDEALADWCREFGLPPERGAHVDAQRERDLRQLVADSRAGAHTPDAPAPACESVPAPACEPTPPPEPNEDFYRSLMPAGMPPHVADGLVRSLTGAADEPRIDPTPTTDKKGTKWGWVDREGRLWPCAGYMDHRPMALALTTKFGMNLERWKDDAELALEELGWLRVGHDASDNRPFALFCGRQASEPQIRFAIDWLLSHGADSAAVQEWVEQIP